MEMIAFTAYAADATSAEAIRAFFEANNVKYIQEGTDFPFEKEKEEVIHTKIKEAVEVGIWAVLDDEERQDFVLGTIIEQANTTNTIDANTMKNKIKQRLYGISA
jgi:hypothetical protein